MREVFISYKSNDPVLGNNDGTVANELCEALEAAGITCWIAPRDIEPGARYAAAIMEALESCQVMVVVFSRFANNSEHIANEVDKAFARTIDIIPFNIDGSLPNRELDYYLRRMQWINASGSYRPRIHELIVALKHKLGKTGHNVYKDAPAAQVTRPVTQNIYIDAPTELNTRPVTPDILNFTVNSVSFKMIRVEGGSFMMGATPEQDDAYSDEKPVHQVTLSTFYIGEMLVTQTLWHAIMDRDLSRFRGLNLPIDSVGQIDCESFIDRLNIMTGRRFRLPTEAEWEFAARGGNKSKGYKYAGSNHPDEVAWFKDNSEGSTHPVGRKKPNELGIYDMSGSLWEWCEDCYEDYSGEAQINPLNLTTGESCVFRGGSWNDEPNNCRVSCRNSDFPASAYSYYGFRLALSLDEENNDTKV